MCYNVLVYGLLRGLTRNLANKNRIENPRGFSEVGENKQLLIAIVVHSFYISLRINSNLKGTFSV